jgi:hypothetical protein
MSSLPPPRSPKAKSNYSMHMSRCLKKKQFSIPSHNFKMCASQWSSLKGGVQNRYEITVVFPGMDTEVYNKFLGRLMEYGSYCVDYLLGKLYDSTFDPEYSLVTFTIYSEILTKLNLERLLQCITNAKRFDGEENPIEIEGELYSIEYIKYKGIIPHRIRVPILRTASIKFHSPNNVAM